MAPTSIGGQELALLRDISDNGPSTVADVVQRFGDTRGLARSTVLTMMERLRRKGYLSRRDAAGGFRYSTRHQPDEVMRTMVERFVDTSLAGAVAPVVAFLAASPDLTDSEVEELELIVERLRHGRGGKEKRR